MTIGIRLNYQSNVEIRNKKNQMLKDLI
jgi:hypothetical protein